MFNLQEGGFRDVNIVSHDNLDETTTFDRYLGLQCNIENMRVFLPGSDLPDCVSAVLETF